MRGFFTILIVIFGLNIMEAQEVRINAGYHGFLDNREYFNDFTEHQSYFGNRIYGLGAFSFQKHHINIGLDYLHEFGNLDTGKKPKLISNYEFSNEHLLFCFGTFHRADLLNYPLLFLSDSLEYYRPLVEGSLFRFNFENSYQQAWIDWTSRQTDTIRETFLAGLSGHITLGNFFVDNHLLMYHYAKPKVNVNNLHIRDNGGISIQVGYGFKPSFMADSIVVKFGEMFSYDRDRSINEVQTDFSTTFEAAAYVRRFFISGWYSVGDQLILLYGEKIYRSPHYARFDIGFLPFKNDRSSKILISLHLVDGKLKYSQLISLRIQINTKKYKL